MQAAPEPIHIEPPLQLLLFVDKRPSSGEQIRQIRACLKDLKGAYDYDLQVIDVGEQPYLAEHFKLIATPALIKISPEPRQTLAGSNLVSQLRDWWPRWQRAIEDTVSHPQVPVPALPNDPLAEAKLVPTDPGSLTYSAELIRLSEEIFRLKQEKESLELQLKFKDQIIAMLAHDLRNPLTAASIAIETLEMGNRNENGTSRLTPKLTAQLLKHARTQTRAIDRMITDILQAARGTNTEFRIQLQELDIGSLCQEALQTLENQFAAKSQRIETDIPKDLPRVYADQEWVRQVLINLLDNAIKYTPVQGKIHIAILHRTTQKVQVSICDNGPGIPEENREAIFEERFRLKRDESQEGYGIGLSLCQRIIRAHYGQIWVDSTLGQGSCFHFTLPVYGS